MAKNIISWDECDTWVVPERRGRVKHIDGDHMQVVWVEFQPGGAYAMHSHPHEQFSVVVQGRLRLTVGDETREVGPGDMWYAPPNVEHGGEILGDEAVVFVDVYSPPSEWLANRLKDLKKEA